MRRGLHKICGGILGANSHSQTVLTEPYINASRPTKPLCLNSTAPGVIIVSLGALRPCSLLVFVGAVTPLDRTVTRQMRGDR